MKTPGAALGSYEVIFVSLDDAWIANHSVVEVLQQELQRRGLCGPCRRNNAGIDGSKYDAEAGLRGSL